LWRFLCFGGGCLENWKDIAGYEGLYQVSDTGKVRSLNWRNRGEIKELSLKTNAQGESQVELSKDGKRKTFPVAQLVAEAFPEVSPAEELPTPESPAPAESLPKPTGRAIHQLSLYGEPIKQWPDVDQIRKELGYHPGTIFECCMTPQKSAYGFKWQYAE
jgi:hypothetical protein